MIIAQKYQQYAPRQSIGPRTVESEPRHGVTVGVARGVGPTTTRASTATRDAHVRCVFFFHPSPHRARASLKSRASSRTPHRPTSRINRKSSHRPIARRHHRRRRCDPYLGDGGTEEGVGGSLDDHRHGAARKTSDDDDHGQSRDHSLILSSISSHALDKPARGRHRVRRPHTHVFPKSRAPSSPPLELRRTTETPRLAVFVTEVVTVRVVVIFCCASIVRVCAGKRRRRRRLE